MSALIDEGAGLMSQLRSATRDQHQSVEEQLDLLRPDLTIQDYGNVLCGFRAILASWEPLVLRSLAPAAPALAAGREKLPLLADDLQFLRITCPSRSADLSGFDSPEALVGGLYVMEGSTLGGQVLLRHLSRQLGVAPGRGASYFNSYGSATGTMWKTFCREAELYARSCDTARILNGARLMFDIVARELAHSAAV